MSNLWGESARDQNDEQDNFDQGYKSELATNKGFNDRIEDTLEFEPEINAFTEEYEQAEEYPQEWLDELQQFIEINNNKIISLTEIAEMKDIISHIKPKFISDQNIKTIIQSLPIIHSLANHYVTFELIDFIVTDSEKAVVVSDTQYIQNVNYEQFDSIPDDYKVQISSTIYKLIAAVPSNVNLFFKNFYPVFFPYFVDVNHFFSSPNLRVHLNLGEMFVPLIQEDRSALKQIFTTYFHFVYRTTSDCIYAALKGLILCLSFCPDFIQEIKNVQFLKRLKYLGTRECSNENIDSREVRKCALIVFEFIASYSTVKCVDKAYRIIGKLLTANLDPVKDEVCSEALYLIGFAVSNQFFRNTVDYAPIVKKFYTIFDEISFDDQKTWIASFANILYFIDIKFVEELFQLEDFPDKLDQCLMYDEPSTQERLIIALHRVLFTSPQCLEIILNHEQVVEDIKMLAGGNQAFAPYVEVILKMFQNASN